MIHPTKAYQVNAFADQVALGSPTGVVEHADNLDATQMLLIAPPLKNLWVKFCKEPRNECFVLVFRGFRGKSATGLFGREIFCLRANTVSEQSFIKWCR